MTGLTRFDRKPGVSRPLPVGGGVVALLSAAVSVLAYGPLPEAVRIRWHLGGTYYGPEYAPALAVLIAFPVFLGIVYAGSRWFETHLERTDGGDEIRPLYEWCVLLTLTTILLVQLVIVALNLHL